jgi:glycosyltransferase involved in cell wall biosynthesis
MIFVGNMSYRPNVDGARFFVGEVLPLVRQKFPRAELWLVGVNPSDEIYALEQPGIHITGRVEEIVPYYAQSDVCVVPLRAGSGTRLKILESMALGRPVVTTTIGCEGLDVENNTHLFITDDPGEYAGRINDLLEDPALYQRMAQNARQRVVEVYDWDVVAKDLLALYDRIGGQGAGSARPTDGQ